MPPPPVQENPKKLTFKLVVICGEMGPVSSREEGLKLAQHGVELSVVACVNAAVNVWRGRTFLGVHQLNVRPFSALVVILVQTKSFFSAFGHLIKRLVVNPFFLNP